MNATSRIDSAALIERVSEHAGLIAPIVASVVRSANVFWTDIWRDLTQAGFLGLVEACHTYNPARSSFITYASRKIEWAVWGEIRQNRRGPQLHAVEELPDRPDPAPRHDHAYELREALDSLSPRQREILQLRLSGYTQDMIARDLGISQVAVRGIEQRALKRLRQRQHPLDKAA